MTGITPKTVLLHLAIVVLVQSRKDFHRIVQSDDRDFEPDATHHKIGGLIDFETFVLLDLIGSPLAMTDHDLHLLEESFLLAYQESASCMQDGAIRVVDEVCIIPDAIDNGPLLEDEKGTQDNMSIVLRNFTYLMVARGRCNSCGGNVHLFHEQTSDNLDGEVGNVIESPIIFEQPLSKEESEHQSNEDIDRDFISSDFDDGVLTRFVEGQKKALPGHSRRSIVQVKRSHGISDVTKTHDKRGQFSWNCNGPAHAGFLKEYNGFFQHFLSNGRDGGNVAGILEVEQVSFAYSI